MYPGVEEKEPVVFKRMCKDLKKKYLETPVDSRGKIVNNKGDKK